eukprot:9471413-Pyramimonas_sp.AAC.3
MTIGVSRQPLTAQCVGTVAHNGAWVCDREEGAEQMQIHITPEEKEAIDRLVRATIAEQKS